jgi:hypothetical protein
MKNKIIIAMLFGVYCMSSTTLLAQWNLGAEGGFQLNNTRVKGVGSFVNGLPKSIATPFGRLTATYETSDVFALRTGLGYSQKGFQIAQGLNVNIFNVPIGIGAKVATKADYVEIPMEGIYKINSGSRTYLIMGGANIGYATGAKIQPKASIIIDINLPEIPINLNNDIYNRLDISGTAGIGMIQNTGKGNLVLQARYVHSFTNFLNNPIVDLKIKPYSYQFSLGYQIPIGAGRPRV